jgi:hypothetical protein
LYADKVGDEPRLAKITGRGADDLDIFEFTGKDLRGKQARLPGTNCFDADIDFLPGMPKSKAAMQEQVFRAIEAGLINVVDPQERRLAWKWSGFAFPEDGDVSRENEAQQHVELRIMISEEAGLANAIAGIIHDWDNHQAHIDVIDRFLKRPEVLNIPPEKLGRLVAHRALHQMTLAMAMMPPPGMVPGVPSGMPAPPGAPPGAMPGQGKVGGRMFSPPPGKPMAETPQAAETSEARR